MAGLPVSALHVHADPRTCKLTGAAAFSGVGIYALMEAKKQGAFSKVRPKGAPIVGGPVTAALGVGECMRYRVANHSLPDPRRREVVYLIKI